MLEDNFDSLSLEDNFDSLSLEEQFRIASSYMGADYVEEDLSGMVDLLEWVYAGMLILVGDIENE